MKNIVIKNNIDLNTFIIDFKKITNKKDFILFLKIFFNFFEEKFDEIIEKIKRENGGVEVKSEDLSLFLELVSKDVNSEIHFSKIAKKAYLLSFKKDEAEIIENFLHFMEMEILDVESQFQVFNLWSKNNIHKWKDNISVEGVRFFSVFKNLYS